MRRPWYWNLRRLKKLEEILHELSEATDNPDVRLVPSPQALSDIVRPIYNEKVDPSADNSLVAMGLNLLATFGVLEPGRPGIKAPDYKRRLYPNAALDSRMIVKHRKRKK